MEPDTSAVSRFMKNQHRLRSKHIFLAPGVFAAVAKHAKLTFALEPQGSAIVRRT